MVIGVIASFRPAGRGRGNAPRFRYPPQLAVTDKDAIAIARARSRIDIIQLQPLSSILPKLSNLILHVFDQISRIYVVEVRTCTAWWRSVCNSFYSLCPSRRRFKSKSSLSFHHFMLLFVPSPDSLEQRFDFLRIAACFPLSPVRPTDAAAP